MRGSQVGLAVVEVVLLVAAVMFAVLGSLKASTLAGLLGRWRLRQCRRRGHPIYTTELRAYDRSRNVIAQSGREQCGSCEGSVFVVQMPLHEPAEVGSYAIRVTWPVQEWNTDDSVHAGQRTAGAGRPFAWRATYRMNGPSDWSAQTHADPAPAARGSWADWGCSSERRQIAEDIEELAAAPHDLPFLVSARAPTMGEWSQADLAAVLGPDQWLLGEDEQSVEWKEHAEATKAMEEIDRIIAEASGG